MTNSTTTVRRSETGRRAEGPDTLVGFLLALRAAGRSPKTEQKYRESVLLLADFVAKMGMPPVEKLTAEHLRHYFKSLYDKGNRPGTVATRYRSLQAFYKWLVEEGELRESPIARIKPPKLEERVMPHYAPEATSAPASANRERIICADNLETPIDRVTSDLYGALASEDDDYDQYRDAVRKALVDALCVRGRVP